MRRARGEARPRATGAPARARPRPRRRARPSRRRRPRRETAAPACPAAERRRCAPRGGETPASRDLAPARPPSRRRGGRPRARVAQRPRARTRRAAWRLERPAPRAAARSPNEPPSAALPSRAARRARAGIPSVGEARGHAAVLPRDLVLVPADEPTLADDVLARDDEAVDAVGPAEDEPCE